MKYKPPACKVGGRFGGVRVTGFTKSPIRWPVGEDGLPILHGGLVQAIINETATLVKWGWGLSQYHADCYRMKVAGVDRKNDIWAALALRRVKSSRES